MGFVRKYRQWVAALLLALYAFIAAPVQLWHHHNHNIAASHNERIFTSIAASVFQNTNTKIETNCPICHHQYSIYTDNAITAVVIHISDFLAHHKQHDFFLLHAPYLSLQNKDPPYLFSILCSESSFHLNHAAATVCI